MKHPTWRAVADRSGQSAGLGIAGLNPVTDRSPNPNVFRELPGAFGTCRAYDVASCLEFRANELYSAIVQPRFGAYSRMVRTCKGKVCWLYVDTLANRAGRQHVAPPIRRL